MDQNIISEVVSTTIKIYAMMTPPAVLSAFISGTKDYDKRRKTATAIKTSSAAFIIGLVLYLFGAHIFALFGFTLDAFRIGSGVPTPTENIPAALPARMPASASSTPTHAAGSAPTCCAATRKMSGKGFARSTAAASHT